MTISRDDTATTRPSRRTDNGDLRAPVLLFLLLRLFMRRSLAAMFAVLREREFFLDGLPVLAGPVVEPVTIATLELDELVLGHEISYSMV